MFCVLFQNEKNIWPLQDIVVEFVYVILNTSILLQQFECKKRTERTFISKPWSSLNKLFKHLACCTPFARVYYKEKRLVSKENSFGLHTEQKITQMRMNLCVILERVQQQEIFFKIRKKSKFENKILHLRDTYLLNSVPQKLCQERTS